MIETDKESLILDLKSYGENELAARVESLSAEDMKQIGELAVNYMATENYIAKMLALGAIEFMEGKARPTKRKRRNMSVYKKN